MVNFQLCDLKENEMENKSHLMWGGDREREQVKTRHHVTGSSRKMINITLKITNRS